MFSHLEYITFDLSRLQSADPGPGVQIGDQQSALWQAIEGWPKRLDSHRNQLIVLPLASTSSEAMVVLFEYPDENPQMALGVRSDQTLDQSLLSFLSAGVCVLSSLINANARRDTEDALRIFGHEIGQLTGALEFLALSYFETPEMLRSLSDAKARDLLQGIRAALAQLSFISNTARMVLGVPEPRKRSFVPYQLLYEAERVLRFDAEARFLQFEIGDSRREDVDRQRGPAIADPQLLGQLVYNLVNNAVKFCHRGTKIHLFWRQEHSDPAAPYILTVRNYGRIVAGGEELYDLYRRGQNAAEAGLGIGLYVAQRIALAHGGSIDHDRNKTPVSAFNVPLIKPYLDLTDADQSLVPELQKEITRLELAGVYSEIVAVTDDGKQKYSRPTYLELRNSILDPTYEVIFRAVIPTKEIQK